MCFVCRNSIRHSIRPSSPSPGPGGSACSRRTGPWVPIRWKLNDLQRQTFWGTKTQESWFTEAMLARSPKSGVFQGVKARAIHDRPDYLLSAHQLLPDDVRGRCGTLRKLGGRVLLGVVHERLLV